MSYRKKEIPFSIQKHSIFVYINKFDRSIDRITVFDMHISGNKITSMPTIQQQQQKNKCIFILLLQFLLFGFVSIRSTYINAIQENMNFQQMYITIKQNCILVVRYCHTLP